MGVPSAGIQHEERPIGGFDDIRQVGARLGEREKFVFGGAETGAILLEFKTDDLLGIVERDHELEVVGRSGERRGEVVGAGPERAPARHHVAEVGDQWHLVVRPELVRDDVQPVRTGVDAAELPLTDGVVPRHAVI